ncbi:MAG: TIM barrel protein [Fimbriimonadaceae bacterium]
MRFGVCCGLGEAHLALALGYDYVELGASTIAEAPDVASFRDLPIEATNLFFPGAIQLFGPEPDAYRAYAHDAIERVASLGVKIMVVGSGASRRAPHGIPPDVAEARFGEIPADLQGMATEYGIAIAPESLNRSETNVGNDLGVLAHALRADAVGYTADLYHILYEADADGRTANMAEQVPFAPTHVHLADRPRFAPDVDNTSVIAFAHRLRDLGYSARISLECQRPDPPEDLAKGLATMRALFNFDDATD